jgi:hypothetical protein
MNLILTSLIILINIQLLLLVVSSSNNTGARGRKFCGLDFLDNSVMTLTVADTTPKTDCDECSFDSGNAEQLTWIIILQPISETHESYPHSVRISLKYSKQR